MIDVGYCPQEKTFKVAAATDQGQLIIFEPDTTKAQLVLDCFGNNCAMTAVRWSKSLQYLAVANDLK